jgi:hypothetical protein
VGDGNRPRDVLTEVESQLGAEDAGWLGWITEELLHHLMPSRRSFPESPAAAYANLVFETYQLAKGRIAQAQPYWSRFDAGGRQPPRAQPDPAGDVFLLQ